MSDFHPYLLLPSISSTLQYMQACQRSTSPHSCLSNMKIFPPPTSCPRDPGPYLYEGQRPWRGCWHPAMGHLRWWRSTQRRRDPYRLPVPGIDGVFLLKTMSTCKPSTLLIQVHVYACRTDVCGPGGISIWDRYSNHFFPLLFLCVRLFGVLLRPARVELLLRICAWSTHTYACGSWNRLGAMGRGCAFRTISPHHSVELWLTLPQGEPRHPAAHPRPMKPQTTGPTGLFAS